jgi:hypothetical protein
MEIGAIAEVIAMLVIAVLVGYGIWNWRHGGLQRRSTKAAVVFGAIAVASDVGITLIEALGPNDPSDAVAVTLGLVIILGGVVCCAALFGAAASLLIRVLTHPKPALPPSS